MCKLLNDYFTARFKDQQIQRVMIYKNSFYKLRRATMLAILSSVISACSFSEIDADQEEKQAQSVSENADKTATQSADNSELISSSSNRARTNFGSFVVPGISLSRWNNSKDVAAWRQTNQPLVTIQSSDDVINDIGVSKNGAYMASVGAQINVWDIDTLSLIRSWKLTQSVEILSSLLMAKY